jgi:hypothetical protein
MLEVVEMAPTREAHQAASHHLARQHGIGVGGDGVSGRRGDDHLLSC